MSGRGPTDPTEAHFDKGLWAFDGTEWRKQPLLLGYSGQVGQSMSDTNLGAGDNSLNGTAVPAGEIWIVTQVAFMYVGVVPTRVYWDGANVPGNPLLHAVAAPASATWYYNPVWAIFAAGQFVRCTVNGATAGNDLYARYSGYKMDIDL